MAVDKTNAITTRNPQYTASEKRWERCRSAIAGQDAIKAGEQKFLPPVNPDDDPKGSDYQIYLENAEYYNAVGLTFDAFIGMIFRKDPDVGDMDRDQVKNDPLLNNVDMEGRTIYEFIREVALEEMKVGRVGLLNDYPINEKVAEEMSIAEARANGIRPYIKLYTAESIINWKYRSIQAVKKLVSVVLLEKVEEGSNDNETFELFAHNLVDQYRALVLLNGEYWQIVYNSNLAETSRERILFDGEIQTEIPFTVINPNSIGMEIEKPPLSDMVDTNIAHYRASAALGANLHMYARATPLFKVPAEHYDTFTKQPLEFGSTRSIVIPTSRESGDSDGKFMEPGNTFDPILKHMDNLESRMAAQGARMLTSRKSGVEAAETVQMDMAGELSILSSLSRNLSAGLTKAVAMMLGRDDFKIVLNSDFLALPIDAGMVSSLLMSLQAGRISSDQFIDALIRGEVIKEESEIITDTEFTPDPAKTMESNGVPAEDGELRGREDNTKKAEPLGGPNGLENRV